MLLLAAVPQTLEDGESDKLRESQFFSSGSAIQERTLKVDAGESLEEEH